MKRFKEFFVHYSKLFSKALMGVFVCFGSFSFAAETVDEMSQCMEQGKKFFTTKQYSQAKTSFAECVKMEPKNVDANLSLAGSFLMLNDLPNAEKFFQVSLDNMGKISPYYSYVYSMLGDIALKQGDSKKALNLYSNSLAYNVANVNSLVGKAVILEHQGDKIDAADFYRSALAVEPLNLVARKRLISLEPEYLTDAEILAALKQRYAVAPELSELSEENKTLFVNIHKDEQRKGIDYLKNKYTKVPVDYTVTINKGNPFEREMLTLAGYQALEKNIGQDAIQVFQRIGVPVKDIFALRDNKGQKIFTEESMLTERGFGVYLDALNNKKSFLLPEEDLPPTPAFLKKVAKLEKDLKRAGYVEITNSEFKMIQTKTKCSEETLRSQLGVYVLPMNKHVRRFFVMSKAKEPKKGVPFYYLMQAHAKRNPSLKVPSNSLVESYSYYGYTVCLDDGNLLQ